MADADHLLPPGAAGDPRCPAVHPGVHLSGGTGGPVDPTLFYALHLKEQGFTNLDRSYASALAGRLLVITAAFTAPQLLAGQALGVL
ncbi:sugar ABC transporter permease [Saccharopolyspora rhizosphaerae]|uniref:sugar ABC transporter permease n=1 Tax=Saccharopolyspora rhizosphaerae TaxID=2492662 RepID=UPI0018F67E50|nr:sugar ABC transporter permease [Saccharopolyspora rhizosphaerae]